MRGYSDSINKQRVCMLLGAMIVVAGLIIYLTGLADIHGVLIFGFLFGFQLLLVSEVLPIIAACLLALCMMPLIGLTQNMGETFSGFSNSVVFFVLASFGLAAAFSNVSIMKRILFFALKIVGHKTKQLLLALMICTALTSSIMSNVPTCVIYMMLGMKILDLYAGEQERKQSGRTVMLAVTFSSMIGGMATPAGSSINIMALTILQEITGQSIGFLQWTCVGIPLVCVSLPICWHILCKLYTPAELTEEEVERFAQENSVQDSLCCNEKKLLAVLAAMIVLWSASSWVPFFNVVWITMAGCLILMLPGIGVIHADDYKQAVSWDAIILMGTVLSIANAMVKLNLSAKSIFPVIAQLPIGWLLVAVAVMVFLGLLLIPIAPSLVSLLLPVMIEMAGDTGYAGLIVMAVALCAQNCYLLPIDTVCLITYGKNYYSMWDMCRVAIRMQFLLIFLIPAVLVLLHEVFGIL